MGSQSTRLCRLNIYLEFRRSTDRDERFIKVKEAETNKQQKSIISVLTRALRTAASMWNFEQINFVVGNRRSDVESDFYNKLKKLVVQEGKKHNLFANHVAQVCEAHDRAVLSFLQQVPGLGLARPTT
jgi:hypothetical protein